jgi:hypothetical protein
MHLDSTMENYREDRTCTSWVSQNIHAPLIGWTKANAVMSFNIRCLGLPLPIIHLTVASIPLFAVSSDAACCRVIRSIDPDIESLDGLGFSRPLARARPPRDRHKCGDDRKVNDLKLHVMAHLRVYDWV